MLMLTAGCTGDDNSGLGSGAGSGTVVRPDVKEVYVSPHGDDMADGGADTPLRTLSVALGKASAGTTVFLYSGIWNERIVLNVSGTEDKPIVIAAVSGHTPVIDGGNGQGWSQDTEIGKLLITDFAKTDASLPRFNPDAALMTIDGASHIVLKGLTVSGSPECGIYCKAGSSHLTIEDCTVADCVGPGICFGADYAEESYKMSYDITVRGNHVRNCAQRAREAISLRSVAGFDISGNIVEKVIKESIDAKSGCSDGVICHNIIKDAGHVAIYLDAGYSTCPEEKSVSVYSNIIENPYGVGICVASEGGNEISNIRIYNNLVWNRRTDNRGNGLKVAKNSGNTSGKVSDIYMYNNTVCGFLQQGIYVNYPNIRNVVIANNISVANFDNIAINPSNGVPVAEVRVSNNLVYGGQCSFPGNDCISAAPRLNDDYTLQPSSPAVDSAIGEWIAADDLTGKLRPGNGMSDMGAYEL